MRQTGSSILSPMTLAATTLALKEWGAAIHALLDGRQTILLRKGGIHEKAFIAPEAGGGFLLFPTVAHTHADRTRPEHRDLLARGDDDATPSNATPSGVTIRAGVKVIGVVTVADPSRLPELADLHIWTNQSIQTDRVEFRPVKPLEILVVRVLALSDPVRLQRTESYVGCKSWIDLEMEWDRTGRAAHSVERLQADLERVRATIG